MSQFVPQELSASHAVNPSAVAILRNKMESSDDCAAMICGFVEGIDDAKMYDVYAQTNSEIFKPWANEFIVLSRAYTNAMTHFVVPWVSPVPSESAGQKVIDRMPVVFSRSKGVLRWLLSDAYLGEAGNIKTRHSCSSHAQVYVATGSSEALAPLETSVSEMNCAYILLELWEGCRRLVDPLGSVISSHGGHCLVCADSLRESEQQMAEQLSRASRDQAVQDKNVWTSELCVLEGVHTTGALLIMWQLPSWSSAEACTTSAAFDEVVRCLQEDCARGRIVAFDKMLKSNA